MLLRFRTNNLAIPMTSAASKRCRKSKSKGIRAPRVHPRALVEARGTQLWVGSFHSSDQSFGLQRRCNTSSSISDIPSFYCGMVTRLRTLRPKRMIQEMAPFDDCLLASVGPNSNNQEQLTNITSFPVEGAIYLHPAKFE